MKALFKNFKNVTNEFKPVTEEQIITYLNLRKSITEMILEEKIKSENDIMQVYQVAAKELNISIGTAQEVVGKIIKEVYSILNKINAELN